MHANPSLASYFDFLIGHGYHHDASELEKLLDFKGNKELKDWLEETKQHNKRKLQRHIAKIGLRKRSCVTVEKRFQ